MKGLFVICLLFSISLGAQNPNCQNIYVWEVYDQDNKKNNFTRSLTNSVEEALVNIGECSVLQRRRFGSLQAQLENESNVQSVREMKSNIIDSLSTYGAELVLFGNLYMISSKEYELQLRVENLKTSRILRMKSTEFDINDLSDNSTKDLIAEKLVYDLLGKQYSNTEATNLSNGDLTIDNLRDNFVYQVGEPLIISGRHSLSSGSHVWLVLADDWGYYPQNANIYLQSNGTWSNSGAKPGMGIKFIHAVLVNEEGHKFFLDQVRYNDWGQFNPLPDGSRILATVSVVVRR